MPSLTHQARQESTVTIPVTSCLIVTNGTCTPPTICHQCVLHRTLVVDPAEELGGLPVLHRIVSARSITSAISPENLGLQMNKKKTTASDRHGRVYIMEPSAHAYTNGYSIVVTLSVSLHCIPEYSYRLAESRPTIRGHGAFI